MIHRKIEHMKERPRHERVAFAGAVAVGAVVVLFVGWAFYFFTSVSNSIPLAAPTAATSTDAQ